MTFSGTGIVYPSTPVSGSGRGAATMQISANIKGGGIELADHVFGVGVGESEGSRQKAEVRSFAFQEEMSERWSFCIFCRRIRRRRWTWFMRPGWSMRFRRPRPGDAASDAARNGRAVRVFDRAGGRRPRPTSSTLQMRKRGGRSRGCRTGRPMSGNRIGAVPEPEDLLRWNPYGTEKLRLADGRFWLLPKMPAAVGERFERGRVSAGLSDVSGDRDAGEQCDGAVLPQYVDPLDAAETYFRKRVENETIPPETLNLLAARVLALNYRVSLLELSLCGAMTRDGSTAEQVLIYASDLWTYVEFLQEM